MKDKNKYATGGNIGSYVGMGLDVVKGLTELVDVLGTDFKSSEPLIPNANNFISNSNPYFATGGTVGYEKWKSKLPKNLQSEEDYDLKGLYESNPKAKPSADLHFPDTFKLPNHPTFSNESIYYDEVTPGLGGYWKGENYVPNPKIGPPIPKMATGGTVKNKTVEVEGQEVAETPNGDILEFTGPSHENGGVQTTLPEGTEIYSKRIEVGGKSMKDRKLNRERLSAKFEKLIAKNPTDPVFKRTLQRVNQTNQIQEERDMALQNTLKATESFFAFGGLVGGLPDEEVYPDSFTTEVDENGNPIEVPVYSMESMGNSLTGENPLNEVAATGTRSPSIFPTLGQRVANPASTNPAVPEMVQVPGFQMSNVGNAQPIATNSRTPITTGDVVGTAGMAFGALSPLINTINNRRGDTPNVNSFLGFGKDALAANDQSFNTTSGLLDSTIEDIQIDRNTAIQRNRNSAQSINTQRALDSVTDIQTDRAKIDAKTRFSSILSGILGQRSQLENQQDAAVMQGEQQRDLANRQDRDNYYTNLQKNLNGISTTVQQFAGIMNKRKQNNDTLKILPELSKYGLGFEYDENGNPVLTKVK